MVNRPPTVAAIDLYVQGVRQANVACIVHGICHRLLQEPIPINAKGTGEGHGKVFDAQVDDVMEVMRPLT